VIARIENIGRGKAALAADIKDVYAEAKGNGYEHEDHSPDR